MKTNKRRKFTVSGAVNWLRAVAVAALLPALAAQAASLTWTGATDGNWDTATANWSGDSTTYTDADTVLFDATGANRGITVQGGGVLPGSITVNNTADTAYSFAGGQIGGTASLLKNGDGTLTLSAANRYSGGTTLNVGKIAINHGEALGGISNAYTTINLNGGELDASGLTTTLTSVYTHIAVANAATLALGHNTSWRGNISGDGELTITQPGVSAASLAAHYGNLANFTGTLIFQTDRTCNVRNTGSAAMTVNLKGTSRYNGWGPTHLIGSLSGEAGTILAGQNVALTTLSVGALNTSTEFQGTIMDYSKASSQLTAFTKVGTGTLTLSGPTNNYSGATTVSEGTLRVTGSHTGAAYTVASAGTLVVAGSITNTGLTVNGTLKARVDGSAAGKVTVTGAVTLGEGSALALEVAGAPTAGVPLTIVENDGEDAVAGQFTQGGQITVDGVKYLIAYDGGDGNDITLTRQPSGTLIKVH